MADKQHPSYGMLQLTRSSLGGSGTALYSSGYALTGILLCGRPEARFCIETCYGQNRIDNI